MLRFYAAALVVVGHSVAVAETLTGETSSPWMTWLKLGGPFGVDLFFVLSGYIIATTGPLASPRRSSTDFYVRRLRRVAPLYILCTFAMAICIGQPGSIASLQFLGSLTFWPVWGGEYVWPYLSVGWTLCYEMLFYSTVALVMLGGRLPRNLLIAAGAFGLLIWAEVRFGGAVLTHLTNGIMLEFLYGVGLALVRRHIVRFSAGFGVSLIMLSLGLVAFAVTQGYGLILDGANTVLGGLGLARALTFGALAALCVAGVLMCEPLVRRGVQTYLGDASYAIYLVQLIVLNAAVVWLPSLGVLPAPAIIILGSIAAIAAGTAAHQWLERPLSRVASRQGPLLKIA